MLIKSLIFLSLCPFVVFAKAEGGLFFMGQTFPLTAGLGPFIHDISRLLDPGRCSIQTSMMLLNTYRAEKTKTPLPQTLVMDFEGVHWGASSKIGLLSFLELQIQVQGLGLYGGFLDRFLDGFHRFFGFPNQGREAAPFNRYRLYYAEDKHVFVEETSPFFSPTQWSFAFKFGENRGASLLIWFKGPVASPSFLWLSHHCSFGLAMIGGGDISFKLWNTWLKFLWGYSLGLQAFIPSNKLLNNLSLRMVQYTGGFHIGLDFGQGWQFLIQGANIQSPWVSSLYLLGYSSGNLLIGFKGPLTQNLYLEAALAEEFLTWATLEVGLHLGISWVFSVL